MLRLPFSSAIRIAETSTRPLSAYIGGYIDDASSSFALKRWLSSSRFNDSIKPSMLILGKPGGGKGTISNKILHDFTMFEHLSTGDLLRKHVRDQTEIGIAAKKHMDRGGLVPNQIMIQIVVENAARLMKCGNKSLLLDGFPRTIEQAQALDEKLEIAYVVNLDVPTDTIVKRIADRWIHPSSGRVYNYSYNPPREQGKDDETGDDLEQRDDDKPETVRRRLEDYEMVTAPLIDYYTEKGVLKTFRGTMSDVIYPEVKSWLNEKMSEDLEVVNA